MALLAKVSSEGGAAAARCRCVRMTHRAHVVVVAKRIVIDEVSYAGGNERYDSTATSGPPANKVSWDPHTDFASTAVAFSPFLFLLLLWWEEEEEEKQLTVTSSSSSFA